MTFQQAVEATPELAGAFQSGLGAVRTTDKARIRAEDTRLVRGSVDIDRALKPTYPNDNRWDYAVGHRHHNQQFDTVYWIEVHPANSREVKAVLGKLQWLRSWLGGSAPRLRVIRKEFIWISSGKTSFTLTSPQQKQFALHGLRHVGRTFSIPCKANA